MKIDNAAESTKVYQVLVEKHNKAVIKLDELQELQRQVDAQVEDYNRIVLALGRSIAALQPAMKPVMFEAMDDFQAELAQSMREEEQNEAA